MDTVEYVLQGITKCTSLKEMSSVCWYAGPALLYAWAELLQGKLYNKSFIFSVAQWQLPVWRKQDQKVRISG